MGAPAVKCAEKRLEKRANAYEQCIISQAGRRDVASNKIPDKSTFSNACAIFSCKDWNERAIFEMHPLRLVQPFLNLHGGRIRRPLLMSRAQRGGVLHAGSFFPSQPNTKTHLEQSDFCCHFALSAQRQRVVAAMFRCFRPPCCALFRKCAIGWPRTHQKERPRARRYAPPPPAEASLCRGLAIPRKAAPSLCNRFAA